MIILGVTLGWRLAALLGVGAATGGAAASLGEAQKRREAEERRLEQERHNLREQASETDAMIDSYYKQRGGSRE